MSAEAHPMATTHLISVSEYLNTAYRPDVDFVEGEIQERNVGERDHGKLQLFFAVTFANRQKQWNLEVIPELRVQVREDRFRVPDICVLAADAPREQIVRTPPVLCIEILSPADTIAGMRERVRDFLQMGVREVWLVDPASRSVILCSGNITVEQTHGDLILAGTPISISIADAFSVLDEQ